MKKVTEESVSALPPALMAAYERRAQLNKWRLQAVRKGEVFEEASLVVATRQVNENINSLLGNANQMFSLDWTPAVYTTQG